MTKLPRSRMFALAVLLTAALTAACDGGPATSSRPPGQVWAESLTPGSGWGKVTVPAADGQLPLSDALQAFVVTVGPLPGVSPPKGALTPVLSADLATDTVLADFSRLDAAEQGAVLADLGSGGRRSAAELPRPRAAPNALSQPLVECPTSDTSKGAPYKEDVAALEKTIGARTGIPFTISVALVVNEKQVEWGDGLGPALADSYRCSAPSRGSPGCAVHIEPAHVKRLLGGNLTTEDQRAALAHELTHCWLFQVLGNGGEATPLWYREGVPTWVMATLVPGNPIALDAWQSYLSAPALPLPRRAQSAVGFWAHLEESGSDVFHELVPIGQALIAAGDSNLAGWDAAGPSAYFLDTWGPGYAGGRYPGPAWVTDGIGLPALKPSFEPVHIPNGRSLTVEVNPYAAAFKTLQVFSDVVQISVGPTTYGMVSLGFGRAATLAPGTTVAFCTEDGGCACPPGQGGTAGGMTTMDAGRDYLGITGGDDAGAATVVGESRASFCARP